MNDNNNIEFLDILTLISFYISILNYNENVSQGQMQETVNNAIDTIQKHLREQDGKIDKVLKLLNGIGGESVE